MHFGWLEVCIIRQLTKKEKHERERKRERGGVSFLIFLFLVPSLTLGYQ